MNFCCHTIVVGNKMYCTACCKLTRFREDFVRELSMAHKRYGTRDLFFRRCPGILSRQQSSRQDSERSACRADVFGRSFCNDVS